MCLGIIYPIICKLQVEIIYCYEYVFLITTLLRALAPHISNEILLKSTLHQFTLSVSMYRNMYVCSCVLAVRVCVGQKTTSRVILWVPSFFCLRQGL